MERRTFAKTVGGVLAAGIGASALVTNDAQAASGYTISDTTITTDDGQLSYIDVASSHTVTWDGFDVDVAAVAYRSVIRHPASGVSHVLYDGTGSPVALADFSSKGSSSDGWGGGDEYASETTGSYTEATGPTDQGFVHAGVDWRVLANDGTGAKSVEDTGVLADFPIEEDTDGETNTTTLEMVKEVHFFKRDSSGALVQMGSADGTLAKEVATAKFDVTVTNESGTSSTSGSGDSSAG